MANPRREPISRRERPAKRSLSRQAIVAAALRLMRSVGTDELTMRRLAPELDTGAASLYVYFKDTDALYAAVLDELLGTIDLTRGRKQWRQRLISLLTSYTELLTAHPALAKTALFRRPSGANSIDLWEALLGLLDEGGIEGTNAAWAADLLLQRATATAAEEGVRLRDPTTAAADARVAEAIHGLSPRAHPHLAAHSVEMLSGPPNARLMWSFDVLLNGLALRPGRGTQRRPTVGTGTKKDKGASARRARRRS